MMESRVKINDNGRVVIPAAMRSALRIEPGDELVMRVVNDELRITTLKGRIERAQNHVRRFVKPGRSLVDDLVAMRREAAKRE